MPNHCLNKIVFENIDLATKERLSAAIFNKDGDVDFEVLLPIPLNVWRHSSSILHENAFKTVSLDWCTENWGTKWNAYRPRKITTGDSELIISFETAWRPPYGWLVALFNKFQLTFKYSYLSQGSDEAKTGIFDASKINDFVGEIWKESKAPLEEHKRLHMSLFGFEWEP